MSKYPRYSISQINSIGWRPNQMNLSIYLDLPWECAECNEENFLTGQSVSLEGDGMRLIAKCSWCRKDSIIKVKGLLRIQLITEASLPILFWWKKCKKCGQKVSMVGNLTNMILVKIVDPEEFYKRFGMMCTEHADEITKKLAKEKGFNDQEVMRAMQEVELYDGETVKVEDLFKRFWGSVPRATD
ncbi:MAG: hypothetical protein FJ150_09540 [Euryarchaeota archaeon]|nr:hypothetical protein [Euryarchaeota archaeon]